MIILCGASPAPHPGLLFRRRKSNPKRRIREGPFRWGPSLMDPSSATTQRGARVGTSSASLILPQASGFGRFAAPPSSSANATLVCLGTAPAGPFFTDSRWINPVRRRKRLAGIAEGRIQRGGRSPLIGRCGGWSLGGGHSRKCPPPMRPFGDFSGEEKSPGVWGWNPHEKGTGAEGPEKVGVWGRGGPTEKGCVCPLHM